MKNITRISIAFVLSLLFVTSALARPPEESEFRAATILGQEIGDWIADLKPRPNSILIYSVHSNFPLDQDYSNVVEAEIEKNLTAHEISKISSCAECRAPQVDVEGDRIVVTRGSPDTETMVGLAKKYPSDVFLTVEIYRTKLNVIAQSIVYENRTGTVLGSDRFTVSALSFSDAAVQVMFLAGPGKVLSGKGSDQQGFSTSGDLMLLEEMGFAKGGLDLGGIFGGSDTLFYIEPTLTFHGHYGGSALGWGFSLGVGYGFSSAAKGFPLKASYDFYLGSFTVIGLEGIYFVPDHNVDSMKAFGGLHLGIALGH